METALQLAQRGFRVWASMRNVETSAAPLLAEARLRGVVVEPVELDVTSPASMDAALGEILAKSGGLYGLVNNAGMTKIGYFEDFSDAEVRRVLEVNLVGVMNLTKRVVAAMRTARRGRIIMMSSVGAKIPSLCMAPYFASKSAIEGFSESLFLEMAPFNVQVVIVEPGMVKTDIWEKDAYLDSAFNPDGPYYQYSRRLREETDSLLKISSIRPADVASVVCEAMTTERPRLRYAIGWRAKLLISLRRHLPGELFERIYFGEILRRVTRSTGDAGGNST